MADAPSRPVASAADLDLLRRWTAGLFDAPQHLPVAFTCGGVRIRGLPADWQPARTTRRIDANLVETIYTARDAVTGLAVRVEALAYQDAPVIEWTAWLENRGDAPSPPLEDFLVLDASFDGASPVLWHCNGDFCSEEGYAPTETPLTVAGPAAFRPEGGRPCDGAFPYFRLCFASSEVLTLAVGWPAQWLATFAATAPDAPPAVRIAAGQETLRARLLPGERIRTPRLTLLASAGDAARATNLWRRWYLAHVLPRPDGAPLRPALACSCNNGGEEFTLATEENQIRFMDRFTAAGFDFDVWWIDAGWYPCRGESGERHWWHTGTWLPDAERFPRGLGPVAAHAALRGGRLLLWFEPERVTRGQALEVEHPEWLLRTGDANDPNALLDLGNPDCRRWLTGHLSALIREQGVGVYRQDFNFPPLRYWRANEAEDRRGMRENLHVQGYLQCWDDLLAAHPGLWIDSCSSGGRRNDLETMRRSVPLHYSDFGYGLHAVKTAFQHTLCAWIPYFKDVALSWDASNGPHDPFAFHCAFAAMLATAFDIRSDDRDDDCSRRMIAIWRRAAPLLLHGDYYPLTPFSRDPDRWVVRQFDRPELGAGYVQAIRHRDCAADAIVVHPVGLRPDSRYRFENPETGAGFEVSGAALQQAGLRLEQPRRSGAVWFYRRAPG